MAEEKDAPKLHIDADWKAQAQAEKQKLAEKSKAKQQQPEAGGAEAGGGAPGGMPPANFETLMSTMATQALFAMGAIADPRTGQRFQNLDLARHHIDMLGVLEEKTKGNLSEEESTTLAGTVYELRTRYVQLASAARTAGGEGE
ncbi:DUF1844 domain-containing protein [Phycisphaerales bacterium AB-hyl4]|uniref:DUF1844 domain-containing protein n=1 Tax=Natronomicrosphaera hydrolytica TaxID=3242702 RepID=A0ABV4U2M7_9BACT